MVRVSVRVVVGLVVLVCLLWTWNFVRFGRYERHLAGMLEDLDTTVGYTASGEPGAIETGRLGVTGTSSAGEGDRDCTEISKAVVISGPGLDPVVLATRTADLYEADGWEVTRFESGPAGSIRRRWMIIGKERDSYIISFYQDELVATAHTHNCDHDYYTLNPGLGSRPVDAFTG